MNPIPTASTATLPTFTSPYTTGAAAITGAMLGNVIVWLCAPLHLPAPPPDVAGTLGALLLTGAHFAIDWLNNRPRTVAVPAPATTTAP